MSVKKIITLIIIILLLNIFITSKTFAISDVIRDGQGFISSSREVEVEEVINKSKINDASSRIYNILLGIGIAVAVIIGAILGIQFIFGSVEGKAKI